MFCGNWVVKKIKRWDSTKLFPDFSVIKSRRVIGIALDDGSFGDVGTQVAGPRSHRHFQLQQRDLVDLALALGELAQKSGLQQVPGLPDRPDANDGQASRLRQEFR